MGAEAKFIEGLPMHLNLGDPTAVIGRASGFKDIETGLVRLEIEFGEEASRQMEHLVEIADLKAIGFAGIMRNAASPPALPPRRTDV